MDKPEHEDWPSFESENFTVDDNYVPYTHRLETYIVPTLFAIIFLVGVVGNAILITIFVRHRVMRNAIRAYILCLSVGDLLAVMTVVPFVGVIHMVESWPWGAAACKLSAGSKDIWLGVSAFALAVLSVEQYCYLVTPTRRGPSSTTIAILTYMVWAFPILFATPTVLSTKLFEFPVSLHDSRKILMCGYSDEHVEILRGIDICRFAVYYAIPLCIMVCFSILMTCRLIAHKATQQRNQTEEERQLVRTVLSFVVTYVVCFTPEYAFVLWFHVYPNAMGVYEDFWNIFRVLELCLSFMSCCVKPIALYYISREFRMHANNYFFCCRRSSWDPMSEGMIQIGRPSNGQNYVSTCSSN